MRPQGWVIWRRGLSQLSRSDESLVALKYSFKSVHARRFQPGMRPRFQVAPRGFLQRIEEVLELRIAVRVLAEVFRETFVERLFADPYHELFERSGALVVRDGIEVELDRLDVGDVGDDGMSC